MIRCSTIIFGFIFIISAVFCPTLLFAGEKEKYTDLRGRSASKEDYIKALGFSTEPRVLTRGIGPMEPEPKKITAVFDIYFQKGSDIILPKFYTELQKIGEVLRDHPGEKIQIEGYTCNIGSEDYNNALSYRRAQNVKNYLVHNYGIDQNLLTVQGYGESRPREDNDTIEGRGKNRRVEFVRDLTAGPVN